MFLEAHSNPAVIQRLSDTNRFLLPLPDQMISDTLLQTAQWFIPIHAVSEECRNHSISVLDDLMHGDSTALQLVDAAGKLGSGLLDFKLHITGNYRQCLQIKDVNRKFLGKYCTIFTRGFMYDDKKITEKRLHFFDVAYTLCVPSSCSEMDVAVHVGTNLAEINATVVDNVICSTAEPPPFRLRDYFAM
ncbi:O-acyltransferase like protein-like [Homalodisca vitripennis]|uniref:O-acyltransferase like protein-like n=1 Tax=Homalodisca vitripennis TaxID=197043 RepID=UPI001EEB66E2|nr:O-acyltransferase like protein-like [Homalodisca vitripennis]